MTKRTFLVCNKYLNYIYKLWIVKEVKYVLFKQIKLLIQLLILLQSLHDSHLRYHKEGDIKSIFKNPKISN